MGAAEHDLTAEHPYEFVHSLADAGFGRLRVSRDNGGHDIDLPTLFALLAEAGQADSDIPQICRGHFTTEILRNEVDPAVRDHWFSRIAGGAVFDNAQSEPSAQVAGIDTGQGRSAITTRPAPGSPTKSEPQSATNSGTGSFVVVRLATRASSTWTTETSSTCTRPGAVDPHQQPQQTQESRSYTDILTSSGRV